MDRTDLLSITNNGLDVFRYYFGDVTGKLFCNIYRNDTRPSCKLYKRNDRIVMTDFGSPEWSGDCFTLVSKIYDLDLHSQFTDIINNIVKDLNLSLDNTAAYTPAIDFPEIQLANKHISFSASLCLNPYYLNYWNQYKISRDTLGRYHVHALNNCRIYKEGENGYTLRFTESSPLFGYLLNQNKGIKLYLPYSTKMRFLYAGEIVRPYIFGLEQLPDKGDCLFITGGEKDVLSLASHGYSAISFNSETASIPQAAMKELCERFDKIYVLYDVDETGRKASAICQKELQQLGPYQISRIELPLSGSKKDKDISDYFRNGHSAAEFKTLINDIQ